MHVFGIIFYAPCQVNLLNSPMKSRICCRVAGEFTGRGGKTRGVTAAGGLVRGLRVLELVHVTR